MDLYVYSTVLLARYGRDVPTQKEPTSIYLILHISVCQTLCCLGINQGQFQPCCEMQACENDGKGFQIHPVSGCLTAYSVCRWKDVFSDCQFLKLTLVFKNWLLHPVCHWAKIRSSPTLLNLNCAFKYVQLPGVQHSDLLITQQRESCFCSCGSAGRGETSVSASNILGVSQCCSAFGFCSKHFPDSVST